MGHAASYDSSEAALSETGSSEADLAFLLNQVQISTGNVEHLQHAFLKFDIKRDGRVHFDEFCAKLKVEPTHFLRKLFEFFGTSPDPTAASSTHRHHQEPREREHRVSSDDKHPEYSYPADYKGSHHGIVSGEHCSSRFGEASLPSLNFSEFALFAWFYLTLDELGLAAFLYKLLTGARRKQAHKRIKIESLEHELREHLGNVLDDRVLHAFLTHILVTYNNNSHETIAEDDFVRSVLTSKSILFPLITYQIDMRRKILGESFWNDKIGRGTQFLDSIVDITLSLHKLFRREAEEKKCSEEAAASPGPGAAAAEAKSLVDRPSPPSCSAATEAAAAEGGDRQHRHADHTSMMPHHGHPLHTS